MMEQMEANVTLLCRIALLSVFMLFIDCLEFGSDNYIPKEQADIIRTILNENGYSIGDDEKVDTYLEITSSDVEVDLHDRYWLVLPDENGRILFLSDKINELTKKGMFLGIKAYRSSNKFSSFTDDIFIDSINIISDSVISVPFLYLGYNKISATIKLEQFPKS